METGRSWILPCLSAISCSWCVTSCWCGPLPHAQYASAIRRPEGGGEPNHKQQRGALHHIGVGDTLWLLMVV
jgi:hypothetical protein